MKILFLNNNCGYVGGVEQYIADNARGIADRGHQVYLAYGSLARDSEQYSEFFTRAYRCSELAVAAQAADGGSESDVCMSLEEIVEDCRPDILYAHKFPSARFIARLASRFPVVRMVHDHDLCCPRRHKYYAWNEQICEHRLDWRCFLDLAFLRKSPGSRFKVAYYDIFAHVQEMRLNRKFHCLAVGSRWMQQELLMNGFSAPQVKIHPPVVKMKAQDYCKPAAGLSILYVGQLIRGKGVDLLLKALRVAQLPDNWQLQIIGEGNARQALEREAADLGLTANVTFLGWIPRDEIASYYRNCLFTVVPSRWPEPFGMVGLEAMTFGRAVAGFAVGGIPDWLENDVTGLTAPPQDIAALAAAMRRLATHPEQAAAMGLRGRERLSERFDFSDHLARLEQTFAETIASFRAPGREEK